MFARIVKYCSTAVLAFAFVASSSAFAQTGEAGSKRSVSGDGVVRVQSAYSIDETIARLKKDIADKGIMFFMLVDQSQLAADAGIKLRPSSLLIFGNPALGSQFIMANPQAGLDWPVRLLVQQDEKGDVWAFYTDFNWIARRHGITDREEQFNKASEVIASITASVKTK